MLFDQHHSFKTWTNDQSLKMLAVIHRIQNMNRLYNQQLEEDVIKFVENLVEEKK